MIPANIRSYIIDHIPNYNIDNFKLVCSNDYRLRKIFKEDKENFNYKALPNISYYFSYYKAKHKTLEIEDENDLKIEHYINEVQGFNNLHLINVLYKNEFICLSLFKEPCYFLHLNLEVKDDYKNTHDLVFPIHIKNLVTIKPLLKTIMDPSMLKDNKYNFMHYKDENTISCTDYYSNVLKISDDVIFLFLSYLYNFEQSNGLVRKINSIKELTITNIKNY